MFTVKYRYPDGSELIEGPFKSVNACWEQHQVPSSTAGEAIVMRDYRVVRCFDSDNAERLMFGPYLTPAEAPPSAFVPHVWVMNDHGATIASYDL